MKEIAVNDLINLLMEAKARGSRTVVLQGTITAPAAGNYVVITSEKKA
jgi:hypothetical protein